ncbi:MAG: hypothetical protein BWY43_00091 [candidate division WS2 bacterium ADurb.Bin280]|uniref:Uncharacterized protein n=1 Tax=candidate division WS2 bacterium ADurb.Bin280 TaxID=1852829 RepID=A0A1V5SFK4_9BACT|nr:MAG: hypothetical protein BWY43_00091 [candidate division WS2 bacterium ADurb.Bin280]
MELSTIQNRIKMIEDLESENKVSKDLLKSELENSEQYQKAAQEAKEAQTKKRREKELVMSKSECEKIVMDIKANNEEISTLKEILSVELSDYYQKNKTDEIIGHDGKQRKFKIIARLTSYQGE